MKISELTAISPIDGRYRSMVNELSLFFSELALMKYRALVEIEYFIAIYNLGLKGLKDFEKEKLEPLRNIYADFNENDGIRVKEIEKTINHDVKAIEYFLKEKFVSLGLKDYIEFIHLGLTSQDINNTAIPLMVKHGFQKIILPQLDKVVSKLEFFAYKWKNITILARTHGQPASPTSMGKEFYVFVERIKKELDTLKSIKLSAKFGGATGNFNAHYAAYPDIDWIGFAKKFINSFDLKRSRNTTQIDHYDSLAAFFHNTARINTILIDLNQDLWLYISMGYLKQKPDPNEVGSSAMPHKINPIHFENSEGNAGIANALFGHLAAKLPISRLQRDLTDSTVIRNIGSPFSHTLITLKSLLKGLEKIDINKDTIYEDMEKNPAVVAEAIQTILRRERYNKPYEALKNLTRTVKPIQRSQIVDFIEGLNINRKIKDELLKITPENYTGKYDF